MNYYEKEYDMDDAAPETYHAQGGGLVAYDPANGRYYFVAYPPSGFELDDYMPEEWGVQ